MLLLDNSAWARRGKPAVRERLASGIRTGEIGVTTPFLLAAGYAVRSVTDYDPVMRELATLARVRMTLAVERLALEAQSDLVVGGHHRISPVNILIAACAHEAGAGVLHYDRDYDVIREHTRLRFRSEWLAPVGSLD